MPDSSKNLLDVLQERRKDLALRALINAAESAYARMQSEQTPDAIYWQAHLKQKLFELRGELAEVTEHAA
jgi:ribosomal protein S7